MSEASAGDVLGTPLSLTYKGHTHPVWRPTLRVLDRVEELVAQRAVAAAEKQAKYLPPKTVAKREKELFAKLDAEENATGGKLWQGEFQGDGGARGMCLILFACLEEARSKTADKSALPPAIPFDDVAEVLNESPEAAAVGKVLLKSFFSLAARRKKTPVAAVEKAMAEVEEMAAEKPPPATEPT